MIRPLLALAILLPLPGSRCDLSSFRLDVDASLEDRSGAFETWAEYSIEWSVMGTRPPVCAEQDGPVFSEQVTRRLQRAGSASAFVDTTVEVQELLVSPAHHLGAPPSWSRGGRDWRCQFRGVPGSLSVHRRVTPDDGELGFAITNEASGSGRGFIEVPMAGLDTALGRDDREFTFALRDAAVHVVGPTPGEVEKLLTDAVVSWIWRHPNPPAEGPPVDYRVGRPAARANTPASGLFFRPVERDTDYVVFVAADGYSPLYTDQPRSVESTSVDLVERARLRRVRLSEALEDELLSLPPDSQLGRVLNEPKALDALIRGLPIRRGSDE